MCASFMVRQHNPGQFGVPAEYYDVLIVPHHGAPVYRREGEGAVVTVMRFALLPSWAAEAKVKFATHNARLETIDSKPTWRTVFINKNCLVPMTDFIEPIYEGEHAGHMVAFAEKSDAAIFAAGVWDEWVNKQTGEVIQSFSIITHDPPPFVAATGHDRCPVFLGAEAARQWLGNEGASTGELKDFLIGSRHIPDFKVTRQRPMRPGWEKRR